METDQFVGRRVLLVPSFDAEHPPEVAALNGHGYFRWERLFLANSRLVLAAGPSNFLVLRYRLCGDVTFFYTPKISVLFEI